MVVVGAKGLAKELLQIFADRRMLDRLYFFDDVSEDAPERLFDRFPVLRTLEEVTDVFMKSDDNSFALGLGNPLLRARLTRVFEDLGGNLTSVVSPRAEVGSFGTTVGAGTCILTGAVITNGVSIGRGCLINPHVTISHDSTIGEFVEISPGAKITGRCSVGSYAVIGTNASILPRVRVGANVTVGAGAVVTKDIPDNCVVAGVPARILRQLPAVHF